MVFDPLALLIAEPVQEKAELPMNLDDGTSITQAIPSAAIRVRNPTASPSGPRNSAVMARTANAAAIPASKLLHSSTKSRGRQTSRALSARRVERSPRQE
jgi:hypothetical protein